MSDPDPPMSKHGYPILERQWKREIFDDIHNKGLDQALNVHNRLDVLKALGGEEYGARITNELVIFTVWYDNPESLDVSAIEDLIPQMDVLGIKFTLTNSLLILQIPYHRVLFSDILNTLIKKQEQNPRPDEYTSLDEVLADPYWTPMEKGLMTAQFNIMNPGNPGKAWSDNLIFKNQENDLHNELKARGFIKVEP